MAKKPYKPGFVFLYLYRFQFLRRSGEGCTQTVDKFIACIANVPANACIERPVTAGLASSLLI